MRNQRVTVRKYGNRRLYDSTASRYVNLEDLATLVRKGKDVRVVDAKTGEDLTRVTLMQVIVEEAKEQPAGPPLELLRQLIVTSSQVGHDFLTWYLKSALDTYHKVQSALPVPFGSHKGSFSPLQMMKEFVAGGGRASGDEIEELRRRIAELETKRSRKTKPQGKKKGKAR